MHPSLGRLFNFQFKKLSMVLKKKSVLNHLNKNKAESLKFVIFTH